MKLLLLTAIIWATASARPELYKENEDFQYSRSSTDEGSKSGYYGSQRGNMGGNYEKAHNMDGLAQHQMSGLVRQVDGELGEGHNTRTGDVYAAANSRGTYGSGKYDLSNLQGRNFGEGSRNSGEGTQSHSSLSSHNSGYSGQSSSHSSGYSSGRQLQNSGYSGYHGSDSYGHGVQSGSLRSQDNMQAANAYGAREESGYTSGHYTQSAYQGQGSHGSSNANQYSSSVYPQNRLIWTVPVKIVGRPGSRVAIPVGVQNYDAAQSTTSFDQNAINSEAEILNNSNDQIEQQPPKNNRHYESSYNYRKQWEKHDTKPEVVVLSMPTENPLTEHRELHEGAASLQSHNRYQASNSHKSNVQSAYNTKSESSQSRQQAGYNSQYSGFNGANSNAYTQDTHNTGSSDGANFVSDVNSKPKSYHSAYSYHKSWERQGDPYEIKPVGEGTTGQDSQRLTSATNNQGFASHRNGNQHHQSHQSYSSQNGLSSDCVEDDHVRVTRSVGQQSRSNLIDLGNIGQQTQDLSEGFSRPERTEAWNENFRQHNQDFDKANLGQQSQDLGQQSQNNWGSGFDKLEDLGQRSQDLGQQTQNGWGQGFDKLEDLGQQNQELGQQSQNSWGQGFDKLEDLGQQNQDLGQQTQNGWGQGFDKQEDLGQHSQDLGQQPQNGWGQGFDKLENLGQQSQDLGQQTQNGWGQGLNKLDNLGHQSQDLGQQTQNSWGQGSDKGEDLRQSHKDLSRQSVTQWDDLQNLVGQQSQNNYNQPAGLESPTTLIQDTGLVIPAWTPIEHQHKPQLNTPTVTSHILAPVLDVYISVNPNVNKYEKHYDQTFETTTINNDFSINEYLNQQNKNIWDDENYITGKNIKNKQIQSGPVQFLKGSRKPHGNAYKHSETLPKLHSYFYRGYINPSSNNNLHSGGQHKTHNYSIQQAKKMYEPFQPNNYSIEHLQTNYNDEIMRDYQKNTWQVKDTNQNINFNSTDVPWEISNQLQFESDAYNLGNSFFRDTSGLNGQQYPPNITQYHEYNLLNTNFRDIGPGQMKPDGVLQGTYPALKMVKTPKEIPEIDTSPLYRPNLKNNNTQPQVQELSVKHALDIIDQPEIYPYIKIKKKKIKKKKFGSLEKVMVEQKNLDDLVEQRDDLSEEIWEQNFISLGKEQNIGHGHGKKSNSKEQSEEVLSIWDQKGNALGTQWHNHKKNMNMSLSKFKNHKQAVDEYIFANTRSIPLHRNKAKKQKQGKKKQAGDTKDVELAYLKEIQGTTPPSVEVKPTERVHSPLWNAVSSYYSFAKDIIVSWFD